MSTKRVITKTPADIGLSAIDLKTLATTTSDLIRLGRGHGVKIIMKGAVTGTPTQGAVSLGIELYRKTKAGIELLHSVLAVTGSVLLTDTGVGAVAGELEDVLLFGGGIKSVYRGGGTLSENDADLLQIVDYFKLLVTVDTASDATTHTLGVYMQVQE